MAIVAKSAILVKLEELKLLLEAEGNLYATRAARKAAVQAMIDEITADSIDPAA